MRVFGSGVGYSLSALGFARPRVGVLGGVGLGLLVGVGALIASIPLNIFTTLVLRNLGYDASGSSQQPFMDGLQSWVSESPEVAIPAIIGAVVVLGPAVEELVFRGGVFGGLRALGGVLSRVSLRRVEGPASSEAAKTLGRFWIVLAALLSSVFFALLHLEPVIFPAIFVLALALCWLFSKTGSLLPSFVAHATFNSLATVTIILSGLGVFKVPL